MDKKVFFQNLFYNVKKRKISLFYVVFIEKIINFVTMNAKFLTTKNYK